MYRWWTIFKFEGGVKLGPVSVLVYGCLHGDCPGRNLYVGFFNRFALIDTGRWQHGHPLLRFHPDAFSIACNGL